MAPHQSTEISLYTHASLSLYQHSSGPWCCLLDKCTFILKSNIFLWSQKCSFWSNSVNNDPNLTIQRLVSTSSWAPSTCNFQKVNNAFIGRLIRNWGQVPKDAPVKQVVTQICVRMCKASTTWGRPGLRLTVGRGNDSGKSGCTGCWLAPSPCLAAVLCNLNRSPPLKLGAASPPFLTSSLWPRSLHQAVACRILTLTEYCLTWFITQSNQTQASQQLDDTTIDYSFHLVIVQNQFSSPDQWEVHSLCSQLQITAQQSAATMPLQVRFSDWFHATLHELMDVKISQNADSGKPMILHDWSWQIGWKWLLL